MNKEYFKLNGIFYKKIRTNNNQNKLDDEMKNTITSLRLKNIVPAKIRDEETKELYSAYFKKTRVCCACKKIFIRNANNDECCSSCMEKLKIAVANAVNESQNNVNLISKNNSNTKESNNLKNEIDEFNKLKNELNDLRDELKELKDLKNELKNDLVLNKPDNLKNKLNSIINFESNKYTNYWHKDDLFQLKKLKETKHLNKLFKLNDTKEIKIFDG